MNLLHVRQLGPCVPRRESGYALLLTLVMLALTAVTIGTLAHTSGTEALRARQAERDLQLRWAEASSRRVLLPALKQQLETRLDQWRADDQGMFRSPASSVMVVLDLQGIRIVARLDDQQAMPNLNQLLTAEQHGQPLDVQSILAESPIRERLVPMPLDEATARRLGESSFTSWGQLYLTASPSDLSGLNPAATRQRDLIFGDSRPGTTSLRGPGVTLWGDGKLNLLTASPQALHRVLDDPIGSDQVMTLLDLREAHRDLSARQLVQMLNMGPSERAAARLALTDRSRTYALWLAVTPTVDGEPIPGQRPRWSLTVVEGGGGLTRGSGGRNRDFRW